MYFSLLKFITMKKFFTFLAVMGIISSSFAQWNGGAERGPKYDNRNNSYNSCALVVNAFSEKRFTVMVDNMQYQLNGNYGNSRHDNMISIPALVPGRHTITVFETRPGFFGRRQKDVYRSTMFLKPGMQTILSINNYGQVNVSESRLYQNGGYGRDDRRNNDDRRDNDDRGRWDNRDGGHH
jgi:hypothetical protein